MAAALRKCVANNLRTNIQVKRNLFGPVDRVELKAALCKQMQAIDEQNQNTWNFDFRTETPLKGRYEWETTQLPPQATGVAKHQRQRRNVATCTTRSTASDTDDVVKSAKSISTRIIKTAIRRRPCTRSCFTTPHKSSSSIPVGTVGLPQPHHLVQPDYTKLFAPASPPQIDLATLGDSAPEPVTRRVSPTSAAKALLVDTLAKVARSPRIAAAASSRTAAGKRKRSSIEVTDFFPEKKIRLQAAC